LAELFSPQRRKARRVSVHGSKVQRFKGCILITMRHFVNVLYGKTDRFHIPTNLEHGIWQLCGKTSIFYEDFGSSILSLSLTLVCDSATLESLFRSNWPLRRSEAALNVEPCTCERLRNKVIIYDNPETKSPGSRSVIRVAHL